MRVGANCPIRGVSQVEGGMRSEITRHTWWGGGATAATQHMRDGWGWLQAVTVEWLFWDKRWFALDERAFVYSRSPLESAPRQAFPLLDILEVRTGRTHASHHPA
jgi:hypothetical protein